MIIRTHTRALAALLLLLTLCAALALLTEGPDMADVLFATGLGFIGGYLLAATERTP